jgi:hypothetical protein
MVATVSHLDPDGKEYEFDVPPEHWPALWAALGSPTRDFFPSKWQGIGELEITTRYGRPYRVDLYSAGKPGAFSAGPTFEERAYYRGGDTKALKRELQSAFTTAKERGTVRERSR